LKNEKLLNFEKNDDQIFSIIKNHELNRSTRKNLLKVNILKKDTLKMLIYLF
jgi:2-octaprenyl-6-methoxyphenol hydroxylase